MSENLRNIIMGYILDNLEELKDFTDRFPNKHELDQLKRRVSYLKSNFQQMIQRCDGIFIGLEELQQIQTVL